MSKWYRLRGAGYNNTVGIGTGRGKVYGALYKYNEVLYGYDAPTYLRTDDVTSGYTIGELLYSDASYQNYLGSVIYNDANDTAVRRGFPCLLRVDDDSEFNSQYAFNELETDYISGRYKFKSAFVSYPQLNYCSVPVKFAYNSKNYDAFCFTYAKIPWYASSAGTRTEQNMTLYGVNTSSSQWYFTSYTPSKIAWLEYDKISNTGEYEALTYITDNYSQYVDTSIDFGETPQEVPKIFKEWVESNFTPIFPYTYTVKDNGGNIILAQLTESPSMNKALLSVIGNQKTLTLTGVNGVEYTLTWESNTPEGKQFLGLSNSPESNRVIVPTGAETFVSWLGDITLYESYGTYRPPATTFDINLYQNSAEVNRVDKTDYLTGVGTLSGALREECSMLTPSIVYQSSDVPTFNYVYIPIFNRYYYVTSLSSVNKNVWRMELNCDVLMTYKEQILLLQGVIGRQENDYNPLLVDTELPTQNNPIVEVIDIPSDAFNTQTSDTGHNFLLTVIGV